MFLQISAEKWGALWWFQNGEHDPFRLSPLSLMVAKRQHFSSTGIQLASAELGYLRKYKEYSNVQIM
jgi:hypothetical protein